MSIRLAAKHTIVLEEGVVARQGASQHGSAVFMTGTMLTTCGAN